MSEVSRYQNDTVKFPRHVSENVTGAALIQE